MSAQIQIVPTPLGSHALTAADYVVIDCETGDAPVSAIESALEAWKPPKNWKPETVEAKRSERAEAISNKAALLDASPIICLALKTDRMAIILNGMDDTGPDVPGWLCLPCIDERGLLMALRTILNNATSPGTVLCGHNVLGFDLPKIRNAYLRHRIALPMALAIGDESPDVYDTMRHIRYYSMEVTDERFVSLDTIARVLGIPQPKQVITGADCPRLHRDGRIAEILTYCCLDVTTTERAFLLMTGESVELE